MANHLFSELMTGGRFRDGRLLNLRAGNAFAQDGQDEQDGTTRRSVARAVAFLLVILYIL
jgi:hypothetical protein